MNEQKFHDFVFESLLGMDKNHFTQKAVLMRNPEGFEKPGYCPICKKELHQNDQGDLFCKDYTPDYERKDGCYWHRYEDGLNYWSTPEEMVKTMAEKNPRFKKVFEEHCKNGN